jgi:hypothetical protein
MVARVIISSYIIDFQDVGFDSRKLEEEMSKNANLLIKDYNIPELVDWEIQFIFRFNNTRYIMIYTKSKSFPVEKYKEITIHIPIPSKDDISWGVENNQFISRIDHLDGKMRNFETLDISYDKFDSRLDYISDSICRSLKEILRIGFTLNGIKIKR